MKMHACLMVAVAAALVASSALHAKASPPGPLCNPKEKDSSGNFYGVRADQYTANPQPNLTVKGKYRTDAGDVSIKLAGGEPGGITGKTLFLDLLVHKKHVSGVCHAFKKSFKASTAQYNEVQIKDGGGHSITVPVHVFRRP